MGNNSTPGAEAARCAQPPDRLGFLMCAPRAMKLGRVRQLAEDEYSSAFSSWPWEIGREGCALLHDTITDFLVVI